MSFAKAVLTGPAVPATLERSGMNPLFPRRRNWIWLFALAGWAVFLLPARAAEPVSATQIPRNQLIQPAALHRELQAGHPPLILQVGSRMLFAEAHIPGAEYAGPAATPQGLDALRHRVANLSRSQPIVLYCGCCPWEHCPNIAPAWLLLHRMGFTHARALFLAHNFGADWVRQGYGAKGAQ
jgi:thiosulfate/3-mercaptopyruvate sulfurtransferase